MEVKSCQGENLVFLLGKILFHAPLLETTQLHHVLMKSECWNWFMAQNMGLRVENVAGPWLIRNCEKEWISG